MHQPQKHPKHCSRIFFTPPSPLFLFSIYLHSHADVSLHTWTMSQDVLKIDGGTQTPSTASLDHRVEGFGVLEKGRWRCHSPGQLSLLSFQPRPSKFNSTFAFDTIMRDVKPLNAASRLRWLWSRCIHRRAEWRISRTWKAAFPSDAI